jgi:hypothetical protein
VEVGVFKAANSACLLPLAIRQQAGEPKSYKELMRITQSRAASAREAAPMIKELAY